MGAGGRGEDEHVPVTATPEASPIEATRHLALLEALVENIPVGVAILDREFRYLHVNALLAALNGLPVSAHLGKRVSDIIPSLWPALQPTFEAALRGDVIASRETSGSLPSDPGVVRHWHVSCSPIREQGVISGVGLVVSEITELHRMGDALQTRTDLYAMISQTNRAVSELRTAEALYRAVCRIAVEAGHFRFACVVVPEGDGIRVVAAAGEDLGYMSRAQFSLRPGDPHAAGPTGQAALTGSTIVVNDFLGSPITAPWHEEARIAGFASSAAFPLFEAGEVAAVLTLYASQREFFTRDLVDTLREITPAVSFALDTFRQEQRRAADHAALQLRDRAIQAVSQGILITDAQRPDHPIIYASPGFEVMSGYRADEVIGRNARFMASADRDEAVALRLRDAIGRGEGCTVELLNARRDGSTCWNELSISPVFDAQGTLTNFVGVLTDITARHRLEHQVRQVHRMEAVGQLASGVAHDFNNLLTVIIGCTDLLLDELPPVPALRGLANEVKKAGARAVALTRQLLAFSRKQEVAPQLLDLNAVVRESEQLLRRLIGEHILLSTELHAPLWPVMGDEGQVEQMLVNLVVNARDAMPSGGTLRVATGVATVDSPTSALAHGSIAPGDYVTLSVSDTGDGMDDETRARIFEPFFTTKREGAGTGLGLSTVRALMSHLHGEIVVDSAPGAGTTFRLYFPRQTVGEAPTPGGMLSDDRPAGSETILLVEDEAAVRALGRHVLENAGYLVLDAEHGDEALARALAHEGPIHLVVTDVVMPHVGGRELAESLTTLRPECKVLFTSGYTDDAVILHGVVASEVAFLQKPYTPTTLSQAVRAVLDGRG